MSEVIVAIHQPNYLPWIGFFHKMLISDIFVFLDHVQFSKRGFINRNKVKGPDGWKWLTVPVKRGSTKKRIIDVEIDNSTSWAEKHLRTLQAFYGKCKYFNYFINLLENIYTKEWKYLADLNKYIIFKVIDILDIDVEIYESHKMNVKGNKTDLIIDICKKVGATVYFSGQGAKKYLDEKKFDVEGIKLVFQNFNHPVYPQRFGRFIPNLSIIDMLFNVGPAESKKIIRNI